jgi:pSer/pThr/pTyr-binding forkhead associated (FHA) protein
MLAIAANALYTTVYKRGTTRQLAWAIVLAVLCVLLLLPTRLWYNLRFHVGQATLSPWEIGLVLVYVAVCGWILPFGVTAAYCLFASPRDSNTAGHLQGLRKRITRARTTAVNLTIPSHQPGVEAPFVYNADAPWGWLEYRNGNFLGQELALKRSIISIGREENNEVWLDDDTISRYHAELVWENGRVYVRDNQSLNGILLNGRRLRSSVQVADGDELGIGIHRFLLKYAQRPSALDGLSDPLLPQVRRISQSRMGPRESPSGHISEEQLPSAPPTASHYEQKALSTQHQDDIAEQKTLELPPETFAPKLPMPLRLPSKRKEQDSDFLL